MITISPEIPVVRATAGDFDLLLSQLFLPFLLNIREYLQHSPKAVSISFFFFSVEWLFNRNVFHRPTFFLAHTS